MSGGKMARYRKAKQREKAQKLASETGQSLDVALAEIVRRERSAAETLSRIGKAQRKQKKAKKEVRPGARGTPFERFCQKVRNGYVPYQGGAPGLGKDA
ncbi:hypothetical protein [Pseudomonas citronellolis]|uniref:hypothetical protein n=1 Tax=Pseudomonas citronellolis TaxID=53408 RepID=UPI00248D8BBF|nr:hypothetical protein [Pseudomonas citronellolis]